MWNVCTLFMAEMNAKHSVLTVKTIFIISFVFFSEIEGRSISLSSSFKNSFNDGNREKMTINLREQNEDESSYQHPEQEHVANSFRRFIRSVGNLPNQTTFHFNDSHYVAEVHWSGEGSSSIMVLMKDPYSLMTQSRPSYFYVSRDYGRTYTNLTSNFTMINGSAVVITDFFSSKADHSKYILVAKFHKYVFSSSDECHTFSRKAVSFYPVEIKYHPRYSYYVLGHEGDMGNKALYASTNNGYYWRSKGTRVKRYFWSYAAPFDYNSYIYFLKENWYGLGGIVMRSSPWGYYYSRTMAYNVDDFELVNQYMFITRNDTDHPGKRRLYTSINRNEFRNTSFPHPHSADKFLIADASENETMVAVRHDQTFHLYISDRDALGFSLSLEGILACDTENTKSKCGQWSPHDFVDLHRVEGLSGVYIATNLTDGKPNHRYLRSVISFDKGGQWSLLKPPSDIRNCTVATGCTLHLSQEFGRHNPYTRFYPVYSKKSIPGFILATGNLGSSLTSTPSLFFSRDAGISWKKLFDGNFYFAFLDHGGVLVAVEKYGFTNYVRYSWNEGMSWSYHQFSVRRMRIYGLLTEPGEKTTVFTLFGSYSGTHSWVLMQIDMKNVLGRTCSNATGSNDYKQWELSDGRNFTEHCLLGKKQVFERRDPTARCFNGYNYDRPVLSYSCLCKREDYMCDYGYRESWLDWFDTICVKDDDFEDYSTHPPSWCQAGLVYNISSGYRKVPGDSCSGGVEDTYKPTMKMCPIKSATDFIFYARRQAIYRYDIKSGEKVTLSLNGLQNVIALDMDYKKNLLFYADITVDKIIKMNLNTGELSTLVEFNTSQRHIEALAFDWLSENLYYTDPGRAEIGIINITGGHRKTLLGSGQLDRPRALALHPIKGWMYWTDWGTQPSITRANMDATSITQIITARLKWPNGLTIDYSADRVYWADAGMNRIESCDLDGANRKLVRTSSVSHPYAVSIYKDYVYWDDWNQRAVLRVDKSTGNNLQHVVNYVYNAMDLKAYSPERQKTGTNQCTNHNCKFICLPKHNGFNCTCPENLIPTSGDEQCKCPSGEKWEDGECKSGKTCNPYQFRCGDGGCIPAHWKCDKDPDCDDASDEKDCDVKTCSPSQFTCANGRCVLASFKCDGDNDCGDRSDENSCRNSSSTCPTDHFLCPNGRCISNTWLCDGDNDCSDYTDELPSNCLRTSTTSRPSVGPTTCSSTEFRCRNGRCIPGSYKCDDMDDCGDNSDEQACTSEIPCLATEYRCNKSRVCVNTKRYRCNGDNDCGDNSDEWGCVFTTFRPPSYCDSADYAYCNDGKHCFMKTTKCDTFRDCPDGSDEIGCTTQPPVCFGFKCANGECLSKSQKCDGFKDCRHGEDEQDCGVDEKCEPAPFGFQCKQDDNKCHLASIACNQRTECFDGSDEDKDLCEHNGRVNKLQAKGSPDGRTAFISWKAADVFDSFIVGYNVSVMDDDRKKIHTKHVEKGVYSTAISLEPCIPYHIAVGVKTKKMDPTKYIYSVVTLETTGIRKPKAPSNVKLYKTVSNDDFAVYWVEDNSRCKDGWEVISKKLICHEGQFSRELDGEYSFIDKISRFLSDIKTVKHTCYIQINYRSEKSSASKEPMNVKSDPFELDLNSGGGNVSPHTDDKTKKKRNTLIWAIPVAIVLIALLCGLIIMGYKYRRLQNSFLAFAARGSYARQDDFDDDDGDEMVVGFHQGDDGPLINRFSDDEPLVVA